MVYILATAIESPMSHIAKLFWNGRSQAVRLPAEFRFAGDEVHVRRDPVTGDVILSSRADDWSAFFALVDRIDAESATDSTAGTAEGRVP